MSLLYHYCSVQAFHAIIQSQSIHLSSLSLSNDSQEGKLVAKTIARLARNDGLESSVIENLQHSISILEDMLDGLGFCLSEKGDLLSQWRGYAADATGFSVGFSKDYLEKLSEHKKSPKESGFNLYKVAYTMSNQDKLVEPTYTEAKLLIKDGALDFFKPKSLLAACLPSDPESEKKMKQKHLEYRMTMLPLMTKLFLLKNEAFEEECEWRLISPLLKIKEDICQFRTLADRLVPYRKFELANLGTSPIKEVILGPKNKTPCFVVKNFLHQNGFLDVQVSESVASYR
jgi:hypothetical protein